MSRRSWLTLALLVAIVALGAEVIAHAYSAVPKQQLALAGDVESTIWTVRAPAIVYPTPDYSVGVTTATPPPNQKKQQAPPAPSPVPVVSGRIARMYVVAGDSVKKGQVVAQLDPTMLKLGVRQAQTSAKRAHAQVAVLNKTLDTIASNQAKLATGRAQLATGAQQLATFQAQLVKGRAQALAAKATLQAQIALIKASLHGAPPPPQLAALLKKLEGILAGINAGLAKLPAAQAKLNAGAAKLATGRAQLNSAASQLASASVGIKNARNVLTYVAKGQDVLVKLAAYRVTQATLRAPADGVVTEARLPGTVAIVNAPIVRIRPDGPTRVNTYLTSTQLLTVPLGSKADVVYDSGGDKTLAGHVTLISDSDAFPPTSFPTNVVHMTRAVKVTITLDDGQWAPPGTPVDVVIHTNASR